MAWTLYKSTDASAPTLNGTVGSLVALLDAVLVNGYGAKAAAGWTKDYTGTNKAVFRNASGSISRTYLRVQDDGPGAQAAREARLRLYSTMSDVDTGTLPTPTTAQSTPGIVVRKSNTADSTARAWFILADEKTAIIVITPGDLAASLTDLVNVTYVGDIFSYLTADAQGAFIGGRNAEGATTMAPTVCIGAYNSPGTYSNGCGYVAGSHTGVAGSVLMYSLQPSIAGLIPATGTSLTYPNPVDGAVYIAGPFLVMTSGNIVRGHLRGVNAFCHARTSVASGDTVTGTGDLSGRTFILAPAESQNVSAAAYHQVLAFETSTPAASS